MITVKKSKVTLEMRNTVKQEAAFHLNYEIFIYILKIYLNPVLSMFQAKLYLIEDLNIAGCVDKMCLQSSPSPFPEQCSHAASVYDDIICKLGQVL